jgi:uncharacterized protein (DUF488 family)
MSTTSPPILWTIGHSTRPIDDFITLLNAHGVRQLVDVRTVPKSRHNPQFNTDALARSLAGIGICYRHTAGLGGLRKPRRDSINTGWRNESFRGYADYMQTEAFWESLDQLIAESRQLKTAIMCAEAVPWRCHRSLIADALVSRGWEVRHLMSITKADPHRLTSFAAIENGLIRYPDPDAAPRLF